MIGSPSFCGVKVLPTLIPPGHSLAPEHLDQNRNDVIKHTSFNEKEFFNIAVGPKTQQNFLGSSMESSASALVRDGQHIYNARGTNEKTKSNNMTKVLNLSPKNIKISCLGKNNPVNIQTTNFNTKSFNSLTLKLPGHINKPSIIPEAFTWLPAHKNKNRQISSPLNNIICQTKSDNYDIIHSPTMIINKGMIEARLSMLNNSCSSSTFSSISHPTDNSRHKINQNELTETSHHYALLQGNTINSTKKSNKKVTHHNINANRKDKKSGDGKKIINKTSSTPKTLARMEKSSILQSPNTLFSSSALPSKMMNDSDVTLGKFSGNCSAIKDNQDLFPRVQDCAHFHYDHVETGVIHLSLSTIASINHGKKRTFRPTIIDETLNQNYCPLNQNFCLMDQNSPQNFQLVVVCGGKSWTLNRDMQCLADLDVCLHKCLFNRKYSKLIEISNAQIFPQPCPPTIDKVKHFNNCNDKNAQITQFLTQYFSRLSVLLSQNFINCAHVLNWFEMDNKGHHLITVDDTKYHMLNTQAIASALAIKRYVAKNFGELSFEIGDMISIIDMNTNTVVNEPNGNISGLMSQANSSHHSETYVWWKGKKDLNVGYFPQHYVQLCPFPDSSFHMSSCNAEHSNNHSINKRFNLRTYYTPAHNYYTNVPPPIDLHNLQSTTQTLSLTNGTSNHDNENLLTQSKNATMNVRPFLQKFLAEGRPPKPKLRARGILRERVFGCDLGEYLINSNQSVPPIVKYCCEWIERHGLTDGIYRLSGITSSIQKLRNAFDEEKMPTSMLESAIISTSPLKYELDTVVTQIGQHKSPTSRNSESDGNDDVHLELIHSYASTLKMYFRELPNPLLTFQLYPAFIDSIKSRMNPSETNYPAFVPSQKCIQLNFLSSGPLFNNGNKNLKSNNHCTPNTDSTLELISTFRELMLALPPPHFATAKYLFTHLHAMAQQAGKTNMHSKNLAIVWAPNLLRCQDMMERMSYQTSIMNNSLVTKHKNDKQHKIPHPINVNSNAPPSSKNFSSPLLSVGKSRFITPFTYSQLQKSTTGSKLGSGNIGMSQSIHLPVMNNSHQQSGFTPPKFIQDNSNTVKEYFASSLRKNKAPKKNVSNATNPKKKKNNAKILNPPSCPMTSYDATLTRDIMLGASVQALVIEYLITHCHEVFDGLTGETQFSSFNHSPNDKDLLVKNAEVSKHDSTTSADNIQQTSDNALPKKNFANVIYANIEEIIPIDHNNKIEASLDCDATINSSTHILSAKKEDFKSLLQQQMVKLVNPQTDKCFNHNNTKEDQLPTYRNMRIHNRNKSNVSDYNNATAPYMDKRENLKDNSTRTKHHSTSQFLSQEDVFSCNQKNQNDFYNLPVGKQLIPSLDKLCGDNDTDDTSSTVNEVLATLNNAAHLGIANNSCALTPPDFSSLSSESDDAIFWEEQNGLKLIANNESLENGKQSSYKKKKQVNKKLPSFADMGCQTDVGPLIMTVVGNNQVEHLTPPQTTSQCDLSPLNPKLSDDQSTISFRIDAKIDNSNDNFINEVVSHTRRNNVMHDHENHDYKPHHIFQKALNNNRSNISNAINNKVRGKRKPHLSANMMDENTIIQVTDATEVSNYHLKKSLSLNCMENFSVEDSSSFINDQTQRFKNLLSGYEDNNSTTGLLDQNLQLSHNDSGKMSSYPTKLSIDPITTNAVVKSDQINALESTDLVNNAGEEANTDNSNYQDTTENMDKNMEIYNEKNYLYQPLICVNASKDSGENNSIRPLSNDNIFSCKNVATTYEGRTIINNPEQAKEIRMNRISPTKCDIDESSDKTSPEYVCGRLKKINNIDTANTMCRNKSTSLANIALDSAIESLQRFKQNRRVTASHKQPGISANLPYRQHSFQSKLNSNTQTIAPSNYNLCSKRLQNINDNGDNKNETQNVPYGANKARILINGNKNINDENITENDDEINKHSVITTFWETLNNNAQGQNCLATNHKDDTERTVELQANMNAKNNFTPYSDLQAEKSSHSPLKPILRNSITNSPQHSSYPYPTISLKPTRQSYPIVPDKANVIMKTPYLAKDIEKSLTENHSSETKRVEFSVEEAEPKNPKHIEKYMDKKPPIQQIATTVINLRNSRGPVKSIYASPIKSTITIHQIPPATKHILQEDIMSVKVNHQPKISPPHNENGDLANVDPYKVFPSLSRVNIETNLMHDNTSEETTLINNHNNKVKDLKARFEPGININPNKSKTGDCLLEAGQNSTGHRTSLAIDHANVNALKQNFFSANHTSNQSLHGMRDNLTQSPNKLGNTLGVMQRSYIVTKTSNNYFTKSSSP